MTRTTLAVAADYADALMTARRAKNWLFTLLTLVMLAQIGIFITARFNVLKLTAPASAAASTIPSDIITTSAEADTHAAEIVRYVIPVTEFLGIALVIVLAIVLLLLVGIMVVGRLIGVSHLTAAFIWCVVLGAFLFPWQSFLITDYNVSSNRADVVAAQPNFKVPGVLYSYPELRQDYHFSSSKAELQLAILKWARYVAFPVLALIILLTVQARSSRGLKMALGETEIQVDLAPRVGELTS